MCQVKLYKIVMIYYKTIIIIMMMMMNVSFIYIFSKTFSKFCLINFLQTKQSDIVFPLKDEYVKGDITFN